MQIGHEQPAVPTCLIEEILLVEDMWMWSKTMLPSHWSSWVPVWREVSLVFWTRCFAGNKEQPETAVLVGTEGKAGAPGEQHKAGGLRLRAGKGHVAGEATGNVAGGCPRPFAACPSATRCLCLVLGSAGAAAAGEQRTPLWSTRPCPQVLVQVDLISFKTLALQ